VKKRHGVLVVIALAILVCGILCCGPNLISKISGLGSAPTPFALWVAGWEGVTVNPVCLKVEQSYPDINEKEPEPIFERVKETLKEAGIQVVEEGNPCDADLTFVLTMYARGSEYIGGQYCYSGAKAEGQATLSAPNHSPLTLTIRGNRPTPFKTVGCPGPADAPFEGAWLRAVYSGIAQLWGPRILVKPLRQDYRYEARQSAAEVLGEMGPAAMDAVPELIEALDDGNEYVRAAAEGSLKAITGQDFGKDAKQWQEWWKGR
jgi:hypothetical protein